MNILEVARYLLYVLMQMDEECIADVEVMIEETIPWEEIELVIEAETAKREGH